MFKFLTWLNNIRKTIINFLISLIPNWIITAMKVYIITFIIFCVAYTIWSLTTSYGVKFVQNVKVVEVIQKIK